MSAKNSAPTLISVGDNCLDVYLSRNQIAVGGNALNVAAQWVLAGRPARYFGKVGADPEADQIARALHNIGLDPADLEIAPGSTAVTLLTETAGERHFLLEDLGVGRHYMPDRARYAALLDADWVHLGTNSNPELIAQLCRDKVLFSVDLSTRYSDFSLSGVPLVFAAGSENPDQSPSRLIATLHSRGATQVVVTCGARGVWFHDGQSLYHVPGLKIDVVDTCGAGDSFIAAFLIERVFHGADTECALTKATAAAAQTCKHLGGFAQEMAPIPTWLLEKYSETTATAEK